MAEADAVAPRLTDAFVEYAQTRGFVIDPTRVATPTDKPRVERTVSYVRGSFWAGESFRDLADAQRHAERWCAEVAGMRIHGTIQARPAEVFALEEAPLLLPAPTRPYDLPVYRRGRCTGITTSRWTAPCTRCAATSSAAMSTCGRTRCWCASATAAGGQGAPAHARRQTLHRS